MRRGVGLRVSGNGRGSKRRERRRPQLVGDWTETLTHEKGSNALLDCGRADGRSGQKDLALAVTRAAENEAILASSQK